jgi:hypothetical protein
MKPLTAKYKASRQESKKFKYVGLNFMQDNDKVIIHQMDYLDGIVVDNMPSCVKGGVRDLNTEEYTLYRSLVGKINWCII